MNLVEFLKKPLYFLDAPCTKHQQLFNMTFDGELTAIPGDSVPEAVAKTICGTCEHALECAEYGKDEPFGVWGGISDWERRIKNVRGGRSLFTISQRAAMLAEYDEIGYGKKKEWAEANGVTQSLLQSWRQQDWRRAVS